MGILIDKETQQKLDRLIALLERIEKLIKTSKISIQVEDK